MKTCPACHRTYADETITFCLEDGSLLSAPSSSQPTQQYPSARDTAPPTAILPSAPSTAPTIVAAPPPVATHDAGQSYQAPPPRSRWPLILGAVAVVMVGGLIIAVVAGVWFFNRDSSTNKEVSAPAKSSAATPAPDWSPTPETPAARNESTAEATPAASTLEMSGVWVGTFDEYPATFTITENNGNSFIGDISGKTFEIIVEGELNPYTRAVTFKETRVIRDKSWLLGSNSGTMSADGQRISGKGQADGSYTWSFKRQ